MIDWIQRLGMGITWAQALFSLCAVLIIAAVVWLGVYCDDVRRECAAKVYDLSKKVRNLELRQDRLQAKVEGIGWRDSHLLTRFDWRRPE